MKMEILDLTLNILDDMKALDIKSIDVSGHSSLTDYMVLLQEHPLGMLVLS